MMIRQTVASDQEKEIIRRLTNATLAIEGENLLPVTRVPIEEICSGELDIGGRGIARHAVHTLATDKKQLFARTEQQGGFDEEIHD